MSPALDAAVASAETSNTQMTNDDRSSQPPATCPDIPFTPESGGEYQYDVLYSQQSEHSKQHLPPPPQEQAQTFPSTFTHHHQPAPSQPMMVDSLNHTLDIFQPLLDPEMLDLFPNGELPDLSAFDTSSLNLDHFEFDSAG